MHGKSKPAPPATIAAAPRPKPLHKQKSIAERRSEWRAAKGLEEPKSMAEVAAERRAARVDAPRMYDHAGRPLYPEAFMPSLSAPSSSAQPTTNVRARQMAPVSSEPARRDAPLRVTSAARTSSEPARGAATPKKEPRRRVFMFGFGSRRNGTPRRDVKNEVTL